MAETTLNRISGVLDRTAAGVLVRVVIPPPPFNPEDIAGLDFWGAARLESYNNDDTVGTFTDQSAAGNDAVQATETNKPIFKTGIINGESVVRFDGVDNFMDWATVLLGSNYTAFVVMAVPGSGSYAPLLQQYQAGQSGRMSLGQFPGSSNKLYYETDGGQYLGATAITNNVFHVLTYRFAAGSLEMFLDGVSDKAQGGLNTPYSKNTRIGEYTGSYGAFDVPELLVYDSALSVGDRGDVETFLSDMYGL